MNVGEGKAELSDLDARLVPLSRRYRSRRFPDAVEGASARSLAIGAIERLSGSARHAMSPTERQWR
jgi:hypothetical protein